MDLIKYRSVTLLSHVVSSIGIKFLGRVRQLGLLDYEMFNFLYPPYFKNWWIDGWITKVYEGYQPPKMRGDSLCGFILISAACVKTFVTNIEILLKTYTGWSLFLKITLSKLCLIKLAAAPDLIL